MPAIFVKPGKGPTVWFTTDQVTAWRSNCWSNSLCLRWKHKPRSLEGTADLVFLPLTRSIIPRLAELSSMDSTDW